MAPTAPAPQAFPTAPAASPTYTGDTVINSAPLLGVGIALTAIGFVGSIVGITVAGNAEREDPCYFDPCDDIDFGKRAAGLVVGFVSLGLAAAGIPMIAVGARQVPEVGQPPRARVYLGPGSLRVTW